jgi:hypothetical protein
MAERRAGGPRGRTGVQPPMLCQQPQQTPPGLVPGLEITRGEQPAQHLPEAFDLALCQPDPVQVCEGHTVATPHRGDLIAASNLSRASISPLPSRPPPPFCRWLYPGTAARLALCPVVLAMQTRPSNAARTLRPWPANRACPEYSLCEYSSRFPNAAGSSATQRVPTH